MSTTPELEVGDALILDASTFHKAGTNTTHNPRTIISLKYTLSFFTQQYDFCRCLPVESYPEIVRNRLGYQVRVPENLEQFRVRRDQRRYKWSIRE
jgi:ectoine hydroxylase-related dioxygenase (phytanoyl-CoA dioxygenase family)